MGGDSEYEPRGSRDIIDGQPKPRHGGEYEPRDSRNVTGTASTRDGRWTNVQGRPPLAAGDREQPLAPEEAEEEEEDDDGMVIEFEPDPELTEKIAGRVRH